MYLKNFFNIFIMSLAIISMTGCSSVAAPSAGLTAPSTSTVPTENKIAVSTENQCSVFPASKEEGVYLPRDILYYYDFGSGKTMVLCSQPGCNHTDDSCTACLENASKFAEYQNNWYTVIKTPDGGLQLIQTCPSIGKRKIICTWEKSDNYILQCNSCQFAYGRAYLSIHKQYLGLEEKSSADSLYKVDLNSGVRKLIIENTSLTTFYFLGASQTKFALEFTALEDAPLCEEEFTAQYGNMEDYPSYLGEYYEEHSITELRIYDLDSGEYTVLANNKTDGFIQSGDPTLCYGDEIIYLLNDDLYIYNLNDASIKKLLSAKDIMTYWLMDGKAFYISGIVGNCNIYYADLATGEIEKLGNQGSTEHMIFGISGETSDKFIGVYPERSANSGKYSWISKKDFYADDYSGSRLIG